MIGATEGGCRVRALRDHLRRRPLCLRWRLPALSRSSLPPAFDDWVAQKEAERAEKLETNFEYIMGWETSNEEGLRGAYDPAVRDKELDQDGVSADVLFADADAITGMGSPPFNAGLAAGRSPTPTVPSPEPGPQPLSVGAVLDEPPSAGPASP